MFNFCSLYSGSTGNCLFIESNETKILIDAGVSQIKISNALASFNVSLEDIDAILVTHEHSDHIMNVGSLSKKFNIPVYCNYETLCAMPNQKNKINESNNSSFKIKDLEIRPFSIHHDASNPCGFNIYHDDKKISIATDIGHVDNSLISNLNDSSFILLEANYDPDILKYSRYPFQLKQRILSPNGHLSNESAGKTLCELFTNIKDSHYSASMVRRLNILNCALAKLTEKAFITFLVLLGVIYTLSDVPALACVSVATCGLLFTM